MRKFQALLTIILFCVPLTNTLGQSSNIINPKFRGGEDALIQYIENQTIISHSESFDRSAEYSISIYFTVNSEGKIHHLNIQEGTQAINDALSRTFAMMDPWEPGTRDGEAVDMHMQLRMRAVVNGNRLSILWVDHNSASVHQKGSEPLKFVLVGIAVALMLILISV